MLFDRYALKSELKEIDSAIASATSRSTVGESVGEAHELLMRRTNELNELRNRRLRILANLRELDAQLERAREPQS